MFASGYRGSVRPKKKVVKKFRCTRLASCRSKRCLVVVHGTKTVQERSRRDECLSRLEIHLEVCEVSPASVQVPTTRRRTRPAGARERTEVLWLRLLFIPTAAVWCNSPWIVLHEQRTEQRCAVISCVRMSVHHFGKPHYTKRICVPIFRGRCILCQQDFTLCSLVSANPAMMKNVNLKLQKQMWQNIH